MWRPWPTEEVKAVFTTESRQKDRRLFTRTHHPMTRLFVSHNRVGLSNHNFIGETDLLDIIHGSEALDHNRLFFVVGETGSGKSELCQWLDYNLFSTHRPIHISRRHASFHGLLSTLIATAPGAPVADAAHLPPADLLAEHILSSLRLTAFRTEHVALGRYLREAEGSVHEIARLIHEQQNVPELDQLTRTFTACPEIERLRDWLAVSLREACGVHTLEPILNHIVEHLSRQSVRPVLLLEDVTTLGFLRDDLLDFIFDLSAPGFDVVMGLTSGFETTHVAMGGNVSDMAYVRDRIAARIVLSNSNGETFFLSSPEDLARMLRGYLACLTAREAPAAFDGLYPFTPAMIERVFVHLIESGTPRQTPRNLLDAVVRPVLSASEPPFVSLMKPHPYLRTPAVVFRHEGLTEAEVGLLYWYGTRCGATYTVDRDVCQSFGFDRSVVAEAFEMPTETPSIVVHSATTHDRQRQWEDAFRELREWRRESSVAFSKRHLLKKGIQRFVGAVATPRLVKHPRGSCSEADSLKYHRGAETLPIYLPGSGDVHRTADWPVLTVPVRWPDRMFEEFLNYSFGSAESIQCFADPSETLEEIEGVVVSFRENLRNALKDLVGMSVERLAFGSWVLVQQLIRGCTAHDLDDVRIVLDYDSAFTEPWRAWNDPLRYKVLTRTSETLLQQRHAYRRLFMSLFHTRDDFVDAELLQEEANGFSFQEWLNRIGQIDLRRVRKAPFRQEGSGLSLFDLVKPVVEHARGLASHDDIARDWNDLRAALDKLKGYLETERSPARLLDALDELTRELGWIEWSIPAPPRMDAADGSSLAHRVEATLVATEGMSIVDSTAIRYRLAEVTAYPIVAWDERVRTYVVRLHRLLDTHLPATPDLEHQRSVLAERAVHVTLALQTVTS